MPVEFKLLPGGIVSTGTTGWLGLGGVFEFDILIYPFKKIDFTKIVAMTKNITIACFSNDACPLARYAILSFAAWFRNYFASS